MRKIFTISSLATFGAAAGLLLWWGFYGENQPVADEGFPVRHPAKVVSGKLTTPVAKASPKVAPVVVPEPAGVLEKFESWTQSYLTASDAVKPSLLEEGVKLAEERRPVLKELIKDDPKEAIAQAVPMVVRQKLPGSILQLIEKRVNQRMGVWVYQGVPPPGETLPPGKTITHRIAQAKDSGAYNLHVYGRRSEIVINTPNAAINGIAIDREIAANDAPLRVMEVGEVPDPAKKAVLICPVSGKQTLDADEVDQPITVEQQDSVIETPEENIYLCGPYHASFVQEQLVYGEGTTGGPVVLTGALPAPPTPAIGQLKVLYIPMTFQDQNDRLPTESRCYEIMRNVADYYSKSSFGKLTTLTTVTPPVKLPKNEAWYVQRDTSNGGDVNGLGLEMDDARAEARKIGYDFVDYDVTVLRLIGGPRATGGWGGGSTVWVYGDSVGVTAHEIGHAFGLAHANFWDTAGTSAIGPGANQEYGDSYDNMGGGGVPTDQYNAAAKVQVKWLPQNYVQNITSSGLYRLYAFDQQALDPRNRYALTITKDSQRTYYGELRQLYTGNASRPWADKGMLLGWKYPQGSGGNIQLIDTTPGSPYGKDDAAIALGQTFSDTESGIHMTTVEVSSTNPKYVDVLVNIGDFAGNNAPTLSLAASSTVVPTGSTVTFTATAADADSDALAYQWQHWGDTSLKLVSPNSPVITRQFSTAGSYVVSCTVSDMKGGKATRTVLITVGNGGSRFTISGRITAGGVGVPNVLLTANGTNPTTTDDDGYYVIANLSANTYSVTPALYGYSFSELFNNSVTVAPNFNGADFEAEALVAVSLAAVDASATENNVNDKGTFRLSRTGDTSGALTVSINPAVGTATTGDYTLSPTLGAGSGGFNTFVIPADAASLDVALTTVNDAAAEGPETVTFALASGSGYLVAPNAGTATVTINDDDSTLPKISIAATTDTMDEGLATPGVVTVTRTGVTTSAVTVNYTASGTATSGADYTALSGSVTIPAGAASATVSVTPINESLVEPFETIVFSLTANAAYLVDPAASNATLSLFDDDTNVVTVAATDSSAREVDLTVVDAVPNPGTFLVTRTGDTTSALTVYYSIAGSPSSGVPALHGVDFEALPGVLQIPAGASSASVSIVPRWDAFGETAEQVLLQLGAGPTDYTLGASTSATVTIEDGASGNPPYVEITGTTSAVEGGSSGVFTFSAKGSVTGNVAVPFALSGSATLTTDYTVTLPTNPAGSTFDAATGTGSVVISTNGTNTVTLTLVPVNDTALEDIEKIVCTLTPSSVYTSYGPTSSADLWLRDNDQPTVWVDSQTGTSSSNRFTEGATTSPLKFYVSRTGSTAAALTVNFILNGTATAGADFNVTTGGGVTFDNATRLGSAIIPAASSGLSVLITQGTNDTVLEGTESIIFQTEPGSYSRTLDATLWIVDNETTGTSVAFDSVGASGSESVSTVDIPVSLSAPATVATSVDYLIDTGSRSTTSVTNVVPKLPYWTRVERTGATLKCFISGDGTRWSQVGANQTISLSSASYLAGLVAASSVSGTAVTATIDNVSITGLDVGGSSGAASFGSVGATNPASTSSQLTGTYTLTAGGTDFAQTGAGGDVGCLVSFPVTNSANCTITARVVSISGTTANAKAGVAIRETTAATSKHMACFAQQNGTARSVQRLTTTASTATSAVIRPYWVRLSRVGETFSAWSGVDGTTWVQTSTPRIIPMGLDVQAGLAVSARSDGALTTAVFDNFTLTTGLTGRTLGFVNAQGSHTESSGTFTVVGSGAQIGGTEDECYFLAKTITGDFDLIARVVSISGGAASAQAGIMVRESHNHRSLSAYSGIVANAQHEWLFRLNSTGTAYGLNMDFSLANGTVNFAVGEQTKVIPLVVRDDTIAEPNESIVIALRDPVAARLGTNTSFTYVIDDNDSAPVLPIVGFANATSTAAEATAGSHRISLSLSAAAETSVSIDYSITGGTATSGADFELTSPGTLTFAPGETVKDLVVTILDDATVDVGETIILTLSNAVGCTLSSSSAHTTTITDNDLPVVSITASDANAAEAGLDPGMFTVSRTGDTTAALNVSLARTGTATSGTDFAAIATPLTFTIPAGASSATLAVTPIQDTTNEGSETVIETISANAAYTVGSPSSATVTIADDDRSTVTIAAVDSEASETPGNTASFTLTRTAPTTGTLSVTIAASGTATSGTDYTSVGTTVSFAANETTKTLTITPSNDTISEGDETVLIFISGTTFTTGGSGFDEIVIHDNDFPPTVSIDSPTSNGTLVASGQGVVVTGSVSDDGAPAPVTTTWSQTSGPGAATFGAPNALSSPVTFSADGVYVLRLTATDTQFTVFTEVTVIIGTAIAATDWISQDISPTTQQRGQTAKVGASYVLTGMGAGYSAVSTDAAHIMARQVTGDSTIVAKLTSLTGPATAPLAGVTIRDSLNNGVNRAVLGFTGGALQFRTRTTVSTADTVVSQAGVSLPVWLKLDRVGASNTVTASYSTDGTNWNAVGSPTVISMLNDTTQVGLTATGNSTTPVNLCRATFDEVSLTPAPSGAAFLSENFGTAPSTQATFAASAGTYTVAAADGFDGNGAFYGWQYSGDLMVTAKLLDATSGALSAKSGIMIRESMDNTAGYVHVGRITTGSFSGYVWRSVAGGGGGGVPSFTGKVRWMRLIRQGNSITAFHAPDSGGNPGTWVQLGSPRTVIMSPNVLVGFAVDNSGGTAGVLNTAQFNNLSVVPLNKAPTLTATTVGELSPVSLDGTLVDDAFPSPATVQWSQLNGPSPVSFANASALDTTASFGSSGAFGLRLSGNDTSVVTFRDITFSAFESAFARWLDGSEVGDANNPSGEALADFDNDGLMNLLEYAVGTNGGIASGSPQVVSYADIGGEDYLRISIPKDPNATDVSVTVEASSDMQNWSSVGLIIETNTANQLTVRDNVPISPNVRRFMRVKVIRL